MHRNLKGDKRKRSTSFKEYALLFWIGVFAFVLANDLHDKGLPQKWATATLGTVATFGFVIWVCRQMWNRWAFWVAIGVCLGVHIVVIWVFFQYVLRGVDKFSILFWYPLMLGEVVTLLVAAKRIHDKLTGKRETIRLSL